MEINKDNIEKKIRDEFEPTYLYVEDCSGGCGYKFDSIIVSEKFAGKPLLARQRLVNDLLKDEMTIIHAFTQKTYTPDEWQKKQEREGNQTQTKTENVCLGGCSNSKK